MTADGWLARSQKQRDAGGEICVFIRCHGHVLAIPTLQVERLMLYDEVTRQVTVPSKMSAPGSAPIRTVVAVGTEYYASWDLGRMLGLAPLQSAWVLLKVPFLGGVVPLALKTGQPLAVQPLKSTVALPPGAFRSRRAALSRAFAATEVPVGLGDALVGLYVNMTRLWTPSELEVSAAAVAEVEAQAPAPAPRAR